MNSEKIKMVICVNKIMKALYTDKDVYNIPQMFVEKVTDDVIRPIRKF